MSELIKIENKDIEVKEYNNVKVLTFDDIDKFHQRPSGTASRNFRQNKKYFIQNEDYYQVESQELQQLKQTTNFVGSNAKTLILLTQTGYLMIVKSFTDDLSWRIQKVLVNNYFNRIKNNSPTLQSNELIQLYGQQLNKLQEQINAVNKNCINISQKISNEYEKTCVRFNDVFEKYQAIDKFFTDYSFLLTRSNSSKQIELLEDIKRVLDQLDNRDIVKSRVALVEKIVTDRVIKNKISVTPYAIITNACNRVMDKFDIDTDKESFAYAWVYGCYNATIPLYIIVSNDKWFDNLKKTIDTIFNEFNQKKIKTKDKNINDKKINKIENYNTYEYKKIATDYIFNWLDIKGKTIEDLQGVDLNTSNLIKQAVEKYNEQIIFDDVLRSIEQKDGFVLVLQNIINEILK